MDVGALEELSNRRRPDTNPKLLQLVPTENSYSFRGNELEDSLVLEELLCEALIC